MLEVLSGEFFWGIVIGLILSLVGGWTLAKFTVSMTQAHQKRTVVLFCSDTIQNIRNIVLDFDQFRDRAQAIHPDFLALIDVEVGIYGRNREHLIHLPDGIRNDVRKFLNEVAVKRLEVANKLDQWSRAWRLADQIQAEGRGPEAQRERDRALPLLQEAHKAADKLVAIANGAAPLLDRLSTLK